MADSESVSKSCQKLLHDRPLEPRWTLRG